MARNAWLRTVAPEARAAIRRIQDRVDPKGNGSGGGYGVLSGPSWENCGRDYVWWVRLSPSTRTATEVDLIARSPRTGRTIRTWAIMRAGCDLDGEELSPGSELP
jgi:hypothetical protein